MVLSPRTGCWEKRWAEVCVLTFTSVVGLTLLVSRGALALVRAHCVDAVPTLTETGDGLTFIHIYSKKSKDVGKCSHGNRERSMPARWECCEKAALLQVGGFTFPHAITHQMTLEIR